MFLIDDAMLVRFLKKVTHSPLCVPALVIVLHYFFLKTSPFVYFNIF